MIKDVFMNHDEVIQTIENDIYTNKETVFNEYNYYTRKYRGNRLNDVNVGLFLNDNLLPVVQIYASNKFRTVRKQLVFSKDSKQIINNLTLNDIIHE